jgi:hypothetical protein
MKAWVAVLAGAGLPLLLCAPLWGAARAGGAAGLEAASRAGLLASAVLAPLGAVLGVLAGRRKVSPSPLWDAVRLASIVPAVVAFVVVLGLSHDQGMSTALLHAPFVFLPGPLAGAAAARLHALDLRPSDREDVAPPSA